MYSFACVPFGFNVVFFVQQCQMPVHWKVFPSTVCDVCLLFQVIAYTSIRCCFVMHPDWLYMHHILSSVFDTKKHRKHILRIGFIIVSCCWLEGKNHFVSFLNLFIHVILIFFHWRFHIFYQYTKKYTKMRKSLNGRCNNLLKAL